MTKKKCVFIVLFVLLIWTFWSNTALELNYYTVQSDKLPKSFDGFCIAHVSDLHNAEMGTNNEHLIEMLQSAQPDIIAITGDIIDSSHTNIEVALAFVKEAMLIAPCYYITGNHEAWISESEFYQFENDLVELGVVVLHDEEIVLEKEGEQISLIGMDDPDFARKNDGGAGMNPEKIRELISIDSFTILLSHRPEFFNEYVVAGVDLVLSGHAHGGQFRIPFVGGLVAPNQGFFPKYDSGMYTENNTSMIVSRGIGNSIIPIRFNNRPEVIGIKLQVNQE